MNIYLVYTQLQGIWTWPELELGALPRPLILTPLRRYLGLKLVASDLESLTSQGSFLPCPLFLSQKASATAQRGRFLPVVKPVCVKDQRHCGIFPLARTFQVYRIFHPDHVVGNGFFFSQIGVDPRVYICTHLNPLSTKPLCGPALLIVSGARWFTHFRDALVSKGCSKLCQSSVTKISSWIEHTTYLC